MEPEVSVVIPCLNEAESIEESIAAALEALEQGGYRGEVIVADNGSTDGSAEMAEAAGAKVVHERRRGYGNAYLAGLGAARGDYIVMFDADLTYPIEELPRFVSELADGGDMVIGDRMESIASGAMPRLHQYIGNPVLTWVLNKMFRTGVNDAHCGMRSVRREVLPQLDLRCGGMEFASEMVIRAAKENLEIRQFPIEYRVRVGESKLSTFRDGWRHLRFLMVNSPNYLFIYPGLILAGLGLIAVLTVLFNISLFGRQWDIHAMVAGCFLMMLGVQVIAMGALARTFGVYFMGEQDERFRRLRSKYRLEHGLVAGAMTVLTGLVIGAVILVIWADRGFGELSEVRLAILAATLAVIGTQIIFSSFMLSILGLRRPRKH